jgi:Arc/MetJ-type ribon-helix-helix transcriptional regulator
VEREKRGKNKMDRRNITLSLPDSLLKKAKVAAALEDKSMSELMREALEKKLRDDRGYQKAKQRQLKLLGDGFDLGTGGSFPASREDLHVRK